MAGPSARYAVEELRGDYSACGRDPDVAADQFGEDVEGPVAVLGGGGQVGAHGGEVLGAGEGAHAPGHLLLDLHHPDVAFGRVVVEGHPGVGGEAQVVLDAPDDPAAQGAVPAADRAGRAGVGGGADQRGGDDQPTLSVQHGGGGQRACVGDRLEREQRVDDLAGPAPAGRHAIGGGRLGGVGVDHGDQFAQQVGVAQGVGRGRIAGVGGEGVVHGDAGEPGQHAGGV